MERETSAAGCGVPGEPLGRAELIAQYLNALDLQQQAPTLPFLRELMQRHVARFSFASVGVQLGDELPIDFESLFDRIVTKDRGGYCFEQNGLMYELLLELGFEVELYLARVLHNRDIHPGLTHRVTLVRFGDERWLVDVGFGPTGPRQPVNMSGADSVEPGRTFRVVERRLGEYGLQTLSGTKVFTLYSFELNRYGQEDCEVGHFYSHRHPEAVFVQNLVVSRLLPEEVRSLRNRDYWVMTPAGNKRRILQDAGELHRVLTDDFGLKVTAEECERLFAKHRPKGAAPRPEGSAK